MNNTIIPSAAAALGLGLGLALLAGPSALADAPPEEVSGVTFKQHEVLVTRDGKSVATTNDVKVAGLAVVQTNGVFTVKQGKERQLREGQSIGADGMLTSPDGSVVPLVDHITVKNGRALMVKDGDAAPLGREFALPDGSRVSPDGSVIGKEGRLRRLLDGQLVKLDGSVLATTDTASLQKGKVVLFKDGARFDLARGQAMSMSDGSRVSGDGFVVKSDGTRVTLKEGEIVKLEGVKTSKR